MELNRFKDAKEFFSHTQEYLLEKEFIHSLPLRISQIFVDNPNTYDELPYLATVEKDKEILAVAIRTPQRNLILSEVKCLTALEKIAKDLYKNNPGIPGVTGLKKETKIFVNIWKNLTGQDCQIAMNLRIHKLEKVQELATARGHLRLASEKERNLLLNWVQEFYREAAGYVSQNINKEVDLYLNKKLFYCWEDNKPVAIANAITVTPNSVNIGLVYTHPEYRKKGYATSMVAELSRKLLDRGFKYCLLFTDLANPVSNNIYRKIGYEPVTDWNEYSFFYKK